MKRLGLLLLLAGCAVDADGDGFAEDEDCDDTDAARFPGAEELCDGVDSDCAEGPSEADADADGFLACADCDDARPEVHPGAKSACDGTDADCDGELSEAEGASAGAHPECPAASCVALREAGRPSGTFWIDGGLGGVAAAVDCEQSRDGGGWIRLRLDAGDGVFVASNAVDNPWHKCADDAAALYSWLDDDAAVPHDFLGGGLTEVDLVYLRPGDGAAYGRDELDLLRSVVSELHPETRMVATTGDDDGRSWQDGENGGLEVYIAGASGRWRVLTPGTNGECGGAGGSWPAEGSEGAMYAWSTDPQRSEYFGTTGLEGALGALGPDEVLPVLVQLAVYTGGGVSFGYETEEILVR